MDERVSRAEAVMDDLAKRVEALERRVAAIEAQPMAAVAEPAARRVEATEVRAPRAADTVSILSVVGRTLVVLGGGYLLRALTESGMLPSTAGVLLGFGYAALLLFASDRASRKDRRLSATAHGVAAVLLAYPLLWEVTTRFSLVSPAMSALALAAFSAAALAVAWRRGQHAFAWAVTLAGLVASLGLLVVTGSTAPYVLFLAALGIGTLWLGYHREWTLLRWPVALAADFAAVGLILRALSEARTDRPGGVVAVLLALVGAYLASIAARTLALGRNVIPFEVAQSTAALVVGLGGAVMVSRATGMATVGLGASSVALGAVSYLVAFAFVDRRQGRGKNFYFYTSLGIVFTLVGGHLLLQGTSQVAAWAVMAALAAWLAARYARLALGLHSAAYLTAAAIDGGLLGWSTGILAGAAARTWTAPVVSALLVVGGGLMSVAAGRCAGSERERRIAGLSRLAVVAIVVWVSGGLLIATLIQVLAGRGVAATPGVVATTRTVILAGASIGLAWAARFERLREWGWLVYPILLGIALKLLFEDLRASSAATLFIAFAAYGVALAFAPRLLRGAGGSPTAS